MNPAKNDSRPIRFELFADFVTTDHDWYLPAGAKKPESPKLPAKPALPIISNRRAVRAARRKRRRPICTLDGSRHPNRIPAGNNERSGQQHDDSDKTGSSRAFSQLPASCWSHHHCHGHRSRPPRFRNPVRLCTTSGRAFGVCTRIGVLSRRAATPGRSTVTHNAAKSFTDAVTLQHRRFGKRQQFLPR